MTQSLPLIPAIRPVLCAVCLARFPAARLFDRKPAAEKPWTTKLWIYDLRTNKHFTLKENPLKRSDLEDFVTCWFGVESAVSAEKPGKKSAGDSRRYSRSRHPFDPAQGRLNRKESERFKSFTYEELSKRDKLNLDVFWLKDESLEDSANLAGLSSMPGFPRHIQSLSASRRKARRGER